MSLQLAAQHLSHQGRGGDSTLVHMSPREVKSLNDLAMAHGGQLSINPQTGLPEAGFLSSILPMVAGFALNAAAPGLGSAMGGFAIPALVGGGVALMSGSLQKGLMAGLGAYGGANLGAGLAETATTMNPDVISAQNAVVENATKNLYDPAEALSSTDYASQYEATNKDLVDKLVAERASAAPVGIMDTLTKGIGALGKEGGFSSLYQNMGGNPMSLLKTVGSAAAPAIDEANKPKPIEETKGDADMGQRYGFSMNPTGGQQVQPGQDPMANTSSSTTTPFPTSQFDSSEKRYFTPSYTKLTPEQAKSMYGYAEGGTAQVNPQPATETPALQMFKQMQAQRAAQPQTPQYASTPATGGAPAAKAPTPTTVEELYGTYLGRASDKGGSDFWNKQFGSDVDANEISQFRGAAAPELAANRKLAEQTGGPLAHEYGQYLRQTRGEPNQLKAPTAPTTTDSSSELMYDPVKQTYIKNPNFVDPAATVVEPEPFVYTGWGGMGNFSPYPKNATGTNKAAAGGLMDAYAGGGMSNLGDYSDGGRLLRGPGDGVSDSIPAMIGKKQPARLADGEFVVPARIVSELGNGSTEAGARKLYAMMDRIQKARGKTIGKGKVAKNSRSEKYLPA